MELCVICEEDEAGPRCCTTYKTCGNGRFSIGGASASAQEE